MNTIKMLSMRRTHRTLDFVNLRWVFLNFFVFEQKSIQEISFHLILKLFPALSWRPTAEPKLNSANSMKIGFPCWLILDPIQPIDDSFHFHFKLANDFLPITHPLIKCSFLLIPFIDGSFQRVENELRETELYTSYSKCNCISVAHKF